MEVGTRAITDRRPVYVPWLRDLKDCSWDAHVAIVIGKDKITRRQDGCDPNGLAP